MIAEDWAELLRDMRLWRGTNGNDSGPNASDRDGEPPRDRTSSSGKPLGAQIGVDLRALDVVELSKPDQDLGHVTAIPARSQDGR